MEQFANNAATRLSAAYTAGGSVLTVASTALPFPETGTFRVAIDNELLLVHVADGTTLAIDGHGLEGTADANHNIGAPVTHVLTAGSLVQAIADRAPVTSVATRTGNVTLAHSDISGLGTSATVDVGTTANKIVQLDGAAKLPAVDGSQLTNLAGGGPSSAGDSPTVTALDSAGGGATVAVVGSDSVGRITLTTGTGSGSGAGSIDAITQTTAGVADTPAVVRFTFAGDDPVGDDPYSVTINGITFTVDNELERDDGTELAEAIAGRYPGGGASTDGDYTITISTLYAIGGPIVSATDDNGNPGIVTAAGVLGNVYEVQSLPVANANGGTFDLIDTDGSTVLGTLAYNCTVSDVQTAVNTSELQSITVTQPGGVGTPFALTWTHNNVGASPLLTVDGSALTMSDLVSVEFAAAKGGLPYVYLVPAEPNAAALGQVSADMLSTDGWSLNPGAGVVADSTVYAWNYLVLP